MARKRHQIFEDIEKAKQKVEGSLTEIQNLASELAFIDYQQLHQEQSTAGGVFRLVTGEDPTGRILELEKQLATVSESRDIWKAERDAFQKEVERLQALLKEKEEPKPEPKSAEEILAEVASQIETAGKFVRRFFER